MSSPTREQNYQYVRRIAFDSLGAMALHKWGGGLLDRDPETGERGWGNVSAHCLLEAARVEVFANLLGLPADTNRDLMTAAVAHDFYKPHEIAKLRANGTSWEAYAEAQVEAKTIFDQSTLGPAVVRLATAVGHETLAEAEALAVDPDPAPDDVAWLVMHYVDDYTINDEWAEPAAGEENDLVRRMNNTIKNAGTGGKYEGIHKAGVEHLGEETYLVQKRVGQLVEARLAALITERSGHDVTPSQLPEFIDQQLRARVAAS